MFKNKTGLSRVKRTQPTEVLPETQGVLLGDSGEDRNLMKKLSAPTHIWRSRLSWKIAFAVFATILVVRVSVLALTLNDFEKERLDNLREIGRTSITPLLIETRDQLVSPIPAEASKRLLDQTAIEGFAVYGLDFSLIDTRGEPTILRPQDMFLADNTYLSIDKKSYETIYTPADLKRPYTIVTRMNSASITPQIRDYVKETIIIVLLMSAFVTSVLMIALSQWILEPVLLLRANLIAAAKNPENPAIRRPPYELRDELGVAIKMAGDLIRQNASNLKRLRTHAEDKIHKLAYYDPLTGLPNRTQFIEKLAETIAGPILKEDKHLVVLSVDLDHFKDINDTMGHEMGDKLLTAVGKRLTHAAPDGSVVARASADEFVIMSLLEKDHADSSAIVERIFAAMTEPISALQESFQVRISVGVARCPEDGVEAGQTLKNADIALNRAKQEGRNTVRFYSEDFDRAVQHRFKILRDLRNAMEDGQLSLHYHPQFDLKTGALIGAEALLRWFRPDGSKEGGAFVPPIEFIPIAEQSGLIVPIGEWVMKTACKMNKQWQERGLPPFRIAVNLSGIQFHRGNIVEVVAQTLKETGLDPKWLELEVTESVFMDDVQKGIRILNELHALGVELAIDDFGTGYSSLSYLRQFPVDRLKIDQSFTRNALSNAGDRTITKTIITLGHSLGLKVIAEGVETQDHENFLREEGCDEVQGFKYSKPIPADKMWDFARALTAEFRPRVVK